MTNVTITNNFNGTTDFPSLLGIVNTNTGGFGWIALLLMIQIIMFFSFIPFGFNAALLSSAFIAFIVGMFLTYLGLVSWTHLMIFLGQILLMIIYIGWEQRKN